MMNKEIGRMDGSFPSLKLLEEEVMKFDEEEEG
jgi:hypothetical protein